MVNSVKISKVKDNTWLITVMLLALDYLTIVCNEQFVFLVQTYLFNSGLRISALNFWGVFPVIYLLFLSLEGVYDKRVPFYQEIGHIFKACCLSAFSIVFILYIAQDAEHTSRFFTVVFTITSFLLLVFSRFIFKKCLAYFDFLLVPIIIIGAGKTAELLVNGIDHDEGLGYRVIGFLEDNKAASPALEKYPILGGFDDVEKVLAATGVKRVFICAPGMDGARLGKYIYRVQPLVNHIGVVPNISGIPVGGVEVDSFFNEHILLMRMHNNLRSKANRIIKRVFDYALTIVGGLLISPILLGIAIWVYKDSPGPVIFKHIRVGKNGKPFPCYKFRSMCVDAKAKLEELLAKDPAAREEWEKNFKLKNDPRITKSGAFLRKTSLDELPQIFNVLRGEMSLVGPRPIIEEELKYYGDFVQDYLMVRPGITGMWQVSGRSDTDYDERVQLDSWYVRNWSLLIDIMLLWRTIKTVVSGKGAY